MTRVADRAEEEVVVEVEEEEEAVRVTQGHSVGVLVRDVSDHDHQRQGQLAVGEQGKIILNTSLISSFILHGRHRVLFPYLCWVFAIIVDQLNLQLKLA